MKVVKVYGALRELLGQCRFELDVATPGQAFKALCVNFPQLERWLLDSEKEGVAYRVMVGKQKVTEEDVSPLLLPFGQHEVFSITPVVAGAGRGAGSILLGVALIGASFLFPGAGLFGTTGLAGGVAGGGAAGIAGVSSVAVLNATAIGTALSAVGAGLVLSGVAQILSPTPESSGFKEAQTLESFSFSGIVNTARQGVPVPIVLGRTYAGSVVVSSGLDTVQ